MHANGYLVGGIPCRCWSGYWGIAMEWSTIIYYIKYDAVFDVLILANTWLNLTSEGTFVCAVHLLLKQQHTLQVNPNSAGNLNGTTTDLWVRWLGAIQSAEARLFFDLLFILQSEL